MASTLPTIHLSILARFQMCKQYTQMEFTLPWSSQASAPPDNSLLSECWKGTSCWIGHRVIKHLCPRVLILMSEAAVTCSKVNLVSLRSNFGILKLVSWTHQFFWLLLSGINVIFNLAQMCAALFQYGGELYFSDVYANLEVPEDIKSHKVLWGMFLASFPSLIIDQCRALSCKEAGVRSLGGSANGVRPEGSILSRLPRNNMRAGETALWVKELVAQGWPSEFDSWNSCKSGKREHSTKLSSDLYMSSVAHMPM